MEHLQTGAARAAAGLGDQRADAERGYLPGIGAVLGIIIVSQFATALGGGAWIPWTAPALWAGVTGAEVAAQVSLL